MSPPPRLIAFDTSTERMAVALQSAAGAALLDEAGGAAASATLLPRIARLLADAQLVHADLDFIAFGRGPGAFTGLRTACSVAQGLAFGAGRPVLPIDSLLVVAEDARVQAGAPGPFDVGVAMDARMDEIYEKLSAMPDSPERKALFREANRLAVAYMPYRMTVHRILCDLTQPGVVGYRRPVCWLDWWSFVDVDAADPAGA